MCNQIPSPRRFHRLLLKRHGHSPRTPGHLIRRNKIRQPAHPTQTQTSPSAKTIHQAQRQRFTQTRQHEHRRAHLDSTNQARHASQLLRLARQSSIPTQPATTSQSNERYTKHSSNNQQLEPSTNPTTQRASTTSANKQSSAAVSIASDADSSSQQQRPEQNDLLWLDIGLLIHNVLQQLVALHTGCSSSASKLSQHNNEWETDATAIHFANFNHIYTELSWREAAVVVAAASTSAKNSTIHSDSHTQVD